MELLNGIGESLEPIFNNQLRAVPEQQNPKPIWVQSSLDDTQLARLLGEAKPEDPSAMQELVSEEDILGLEGAESAAPNEQALKEEDPTGTAVDEQAMGKQGMDEKALDRKAEGEELAQPEDLKLKPAKTTSLSEAALPETALQETALPEKGVDTAEGAISKAGTPSEPSPEPSKPVAPEPETPSRAPTINIEPERISPTSTLGGSARELLNPDGTLR
jgi:hypothetical protein